MAGENANLEVLSTRSGFNSAVRYIKKTIEIASSSENNNLSDVLYLLEDKEMTGARVGLLLRMLLVDKLGYKTISANLSAATDNLVKLAEEFEKWKAVDLVVAYHHPELGLLIANPKIANELAGFDQLRKNELLVLYAGYKGKETDDACEKAANLALKLFSGEKVEIPQSLYKGNFTVQRLAKPKEELKTSAPKVKEAKAKTSKEKTGSAAPAKAATPQQVKISGPVKMTPRYAVVVQNELFHNGNVEAWKRIVMSYNSKHPTLEVFIYYEGERILDINSLFKWGKVKHGSAIEFAVAGSEIQDVAKLQRYLAQGASNMFEAFLRGPMNTVLKLF